MPSENTIAEKIRAEVVTNSSNVQFVQGFQEARAAAARIAEAVEAKLREELEAAKAKIAELQADPDYTTVYMAGVAEGKDAAAKELEALRAKLARAREAFEAVVRNDKTPPYQYHGVLSSLNAENTPPAIGQRWNTPAEIARAFLKETK